MSNRSLILVLVFVLTTPCFAFGQNAKPTRRVAGPLETVRQFYSWYLNRLNENDSTPLKNRTTALEYLTPEFLSGETSQFLRGELHFQKSMEADVIICSHRVDPAWEDSFEVKMFSNFGSRAKVVLALSKAEFNSFQYLVSLKQTQAGWRIDGVDCSAVGQISY